MKINRIFLVFVCFLTFSCSMIEEKDELVKIKTAYGEMVVVLFDDTPVHKHNFLALAKSGKYDSTFFHRVIKDFMIQGGDTAKKLFVESSGLLPAEIIPTHYHEKGALAAARKPDNVNKDRKSSSCQFYIVDGREFTSEELQELADKENRRILAQPVRTAVMSKKYPDLNELFDSLGRTGNAKQVNETILGLRPRLSEIFGPIREFKYSDEQKEIYTTQGGAPHLDGLYSVFGKVINGLEVIDSVANQRVDRFNVPFPENIYMTMEVIKMAKSDVTKKYGYEYPITAEE